MTRFITANPWPAGAVRDYEQGIDVSEAMIHVAMGSLILRRISHCAISQTDSQQKVITVRLKSKSELAEMSVSVRNLHGGDSPKIVTAIVSAYNEAKRIAAVLGVLTLYPFSEIIVVDDGSSDDTASIASRFHVTVIRHNTNQGKGTAMATGVAAARSDFFFFCDADIAGLDLRMIHDIVKPVTDGSTEMMIGMCYRRIYALPFVLALTPHLGGQRAVTRGLWDTVPQTYKRGFEIETALNFYAKRHSGGFRCRAHPGMKHVIKERKMGLAQGSWARLKMCLTVVATYAEFQVMLPIRRGRSVPLPSTTQAVQ